MTYGSKKNCGCKENKIHCGCNEPVVCGCSTKTDLLCTYYSGNTLLPLNIEPGTDGNTVIKIINDYIKNFIDNIEIDPTVIESIGGKIAIYKGLSNSFIHQIKSIQGQPNGGVIVENVETNPNNCNDKGDYINVKIDENWLTDFLNQWILTVDLCPLIENCSTQPPIHSPGTTNIIKSIANRVTYTFTSSDFLTHFIDSQGHPLKNITITGTTTGYKYNGVPYVAGTEIPIADINAGQLVYQSDNIDTAYVKTVNYVAKDSLDNVSNISQIIINVAAKIFLVFSTPTVSLIREISNTKTAIINYTNGTGQNIPSGTILVNQGAVGQPGYLKITTTALVNANSSGTIPIQVVSTPTATQANQTVNYTIDGSVGNINLVYNSKPQNTDIVINLPHQGSHTFTTAEFVSHYTDFDLDNLTEIKAETPVDGYLYNGSPYVAGTWIPVNNANLLTYNATTQTTAYSKVTPWFAKDSQGNISS